ncbi:hypothetical protein [Acinetobacter sp.]|uniref:hypothetical protein n=1 Tax=Acinetobacter sp. TaxID=472 RepID=UPI00388E9F7B
MSLNINNKSAVVNKQNEEFSYFSLNKKVFNELILIPRSKNILFQIMVHLACKVTYKNGLVGVHSEVFKTGLAKEMKINDGDISGYLKQLEKLNYIKIFNTTPLVLQVLEVPQAPNFDDIKAVLLYVSMNAQEFNFHRNLKRRATFFETFKEYESEIFKEKIKKSTVPDDYENIPTTDDIEDIFGYTK